jgi:hypothetical protein
MGNGLMQLLSHLNNRGSPLLRATKGDPISLESDVHPDVRPEDKMSPEVSSKVGLFVS